MRQSFVKVSLMIVAAGLVTGAWAQERVLLRSSVEAISAELTLADLLPDGAAPSVRDVAAEVPLGRAPQPGYERTLTAAFVRSQSRVIGDRGLADSLDIPAAVRVRRKTYAINEGAISLRVAEALRAAGCPTFSAAAGDLLTVSGPVFHTNSEPELEVLGIDRDMLRSTVRIRLRATGSEGGVPFMATLPVGGGGGVPDDACLGGRSGPSVTNRTALDRAESLRGPYLARVGEPATLQAVGRGLRLFMTVVPLENGREGEVVRVQNTDTDGVVSATVIGPGLLEREF